MLILKPIAHPTIWGGKRLTPYSGSDCEKIGHLYSVYHSGSTSNLIMNGNWKGRTLSEYFYENKEKYHLGKYREFPLVIALVDAADDLSIQVHPDDAAAWELEGESHGKNESWYFIEAPETGNIYNGCRCRTVEELRNLTEEGRAEECIDCLPVKKGDYVYISGGTLHSLSAGSFVYEIEENTEITYRLYDFDRLDISGRKRPLQTEQALRCVHPGEKSEICRYGTEPIRERMYTTQKYENIVGYKNESDTLACITVLSEKGKLTEEDISVQMGQTVILEPGESLSADMDMTEAIVARPNTD